MPRGQNPNSKKALKENWQGMNRERIEKASATKAMKKTFREELEKELEQLVKDKNGNQTTTKNAMTKTVVQQALRGNLKAFELIRDTIGEKPAENIVLFEADASVITEVEMMVYGAP